MNFCVIDVEAANADLLVLPAFLTALERLVGVAREPKGSL
jgi:hypothetical protein